MSYRYGRPARRNSHPGSSAPLTPPQELVGQSVTWRPKGTDGRRYSPVFGTVQSFDAEARVLVIRVQQSVNMWQTKPHRDERVELSHGPFTTT